MKKPVLQLSVIAAALLTSGCVSTQLTSSVNERYTKAREGADASLAKALPPTTKQSIEKSEEVDAPWIVGASVPLARDATLPPVFNKGVRTAVMFDTQWISLSTAAERIMLATGLVVTVAPDVYLDSSALQRKSVKDNGAGATQAAAPQGLATVALSTPAVANPVPLPLPGMSPVVPVASSGAGKGTHPAESPNGFDMPNMNAPLSQILDIISAKLGIKWRYDYPTNSLRFYRLVTKTWNTPFRSTKASYKAAMQGDIAQSNNQNAITARNNANSPIDSDMKDLVELDTMRDSLDVVMTRSGTAFANPVTGQITLTDTAESVDLADSIMTDAIRQVSRVVTLHLQTIKVTYNRSGEAAVDVQAAVARALSNLPDFTASFMSAAPLATTNSGQLGLHIYSGPASGSSAIVKALEEIGTVETSNEIPLSTRNRKPVYYNVRQTFSYVASTTPAAAVTGGTGGTPGITTAQDQVGLKLFMVPEITSRDIVNLSMSLDQSTLKSLETFSSGTGTNMQSVQLPDKDGEGSMQEVMLRNGRTTILTGFDTKSNQYDKRTLGSHMPVVAGGSLSSSETRSTTIVLVTADISDDMAN